MAAYADLDRLLATISIDGPPDRYETDVVPYLIDEWLGDYLAGAPGAQLVETTLDGFSYLFDVAHERLVAAWGVSTGRFGGERPESRMRGHPRGAGARYHRGHAIAHSLGGGVDINLVPQLGSVNVGSFRELEKQAVATPGALYFVHWLYGAPGSQVPGSVEQGLLVPGCAPTIRPQPN